MTVRSTARGENSKALGDLAPHQEAEPVGPVQEARVLDLLVQARGVEAELLDELDLGAQGRRRSGAARCDSGQ